MFNGALMKKKAWNMFNSLSILVIYKKDEEKKNFIMRFLLIKRPLYEMFRKVLLKNFKCFSLGVGKDAE